jgi:hypothetical protein
MRLYVPLLLGLDEVTVKVNVAELKVKIEESRLDPS